MNLADIIGFAAAILTAISFFPQALRVWRTRETRGISLGMYCVFSMGVALWVVYGLLAPSWPVLVAKLVTLVLALSILVMKVRYERPARAAVSRGQAVIPARPAAAPASVTPEQRREASEGLRE